MATETGGEEEIAPGINNPPLAAAARDSVTVATSKLLTESYQPLSRVLTDFDKLSSAVGVASNPSFPSRILFYSAWR